MKTYDTGLAKWNFNEPTDYDPRCRQHMHRMLGPCPDCGAPCFDYGGGWRCRAMYCNRSPGNPAPNVGDAPKWWNTGVNVQKDGTQWCATGPGFINLQESPAGFGNTPQQAVDELIRAFVEIGGGAMFDNL